MLTNTRTTSQDPVLSALFLAVAGLVPVVAIVLMSL